MADAIKAQVARAYLPLLSPSRYKGAWGGRGSGKSWFFAERMVIRTYERPLRCVCIREVQHTLRESARDLIAARIEKLGLADFFDVQEDRIVGPDGRLIIMRGMQSYNAENIKSLEDFDIAWVEEAQTLSARSLRFLRPTIRKKGSELWFSWNPRHDTDPVDKFFRGGEPRRNAIVVNVNWHDNPWITEELIEDKDDDYAEDAEMADHVWGGNYEVVSAGSYYAKRIAEAEREGRVGFFPHIPELPVFTSWDIGVDDYSAVWFLQVRYLDDGAPRVRIIDYWESDNIGVDEILQWALPEYSDDLQLMSEAFAELGRRDPFVYARHFFPHDIGNREWGAGAKSRIEIVNRLGIPLGLIHRGVAQDPEERIAASRALIPICEFHQSKRVMHGLSRLRRYQRKMNEQLGVYMGPLKDGNDHGADAFGEFAVNCGLRPQKRAPERRHIPAGKVVPPPLVPYNPRRIIL